MIQTAEDGSRVYKPYGEGRRLFRWISGTEQAPDEAIFEGVTKCVGGETILAGQRFDRLAAQGRPVPVLTLNGWVLASAPYARGWGDLYRVTMRSGRSMVVADLHRFLGPLGWVYARDLVPGAKLLSGSHAGAPRWWRTAGGSQDGYRSSHRLCGQRPQSASGTGLAAAPSLSGAHGHSQPHWPLGDRALSPASTPICPACGLPPIGDGEPLAGCSSAILQASGASTPGAQSHAAWRSSTPSWCSSLEPQLSPSASSPLRTSRAQRRDSDDTHPRGHAWGECPLCGGCGGWTPSSSPWPPRLTSCASGADTGSQSLGALLRSGAVPSSSWGHYSAWWDTVECIQYERSDLFYDLEVPVEAHYWSQGLLSHNSGKTRMAAEWVKSVCNNFPDSKGLVLRKEKTTLVDAWQDIFETQVLGLDHPALGTGGKGVNRDRYKHPSLGGEVVLGGMDRPLKLFSTNYDWIYVNECQELTKNEWESLIRATFGRTSSVPFRILWGDCNPAEQGHWANKRCTDKGGPALRIRGRFWDNPMLFDHDKYAEGLRLGYDAHEWGKECWTEEGQRVLGRFARTMTGHRKQRLFYGKWVSAEGAVWPQWDEHIHVISGKLERDDIGHYIDVPGWEHRVRLAWFIGSHDVGNIAPGTAQVWGVDTMGTAYLVAQVYKRGLDHEEWADIWGDLASEFKLSAVVCDHDQAFQRQMNKKIVRKAKDGLPLFRNWDKHRGPTGEKAGIDEVRVRLRQQPHGRRGLYVLRTSLRLGADPLLADMGKPTCFQEEVESYRVAEVEDDKPVKEAPIKVDDHGCDAARGAMCFLRDHNWAPTIHEREYEPGTMGAILRHADVHRPASPYKRRKRRR